MYHIFFIHFSVDAHPGCIHVLAVVNSAAMNIGVHVSFWIRVLSGYMPRSGISKFQIFSPILWVVLFIYHFLCYEKVTGLIRSHLFIFVFISVALGDWPKETLIQFMSENVLPMISSRSFMVSCLMLSISDILSLFLCMVRECVLTTLIYIRLSSFPNTTCWRNSLFPIILASFVEDYI